MTELSLAGVQKAYDEAVALRDVDLSIVDGEFFTLVGPSGCGKTTTLRLIAGFEEPTEGVVRFGGSDVTGVPPEERDVGIVFQNYALFPHMTVRENVAYGLKFRDVPGGASREERVTDLLDLVDLPGMGDRRPAELSGGQQQRVSLARALAPSPDVLLLDEPLSALDARLRERLRVQLKEIQSDLDITTVYVTHDQAEALAVSDRIAVMNEGRIEQVGTPEDVYERPETRFVASFVGDTNLLDGTVVGRGGPESAPAVQVDGTTFQVDWDGETGRQGPVTLCVRPEDVAFGAVETERSAVNEISVAVESVEYMGDAYRVHCDWKGHDLLVKTDRRPPEGEARVGFAPDDVRVLQADDDNSAD